MGDTDIVSQDTEAPVTETTHTQPTASKYEDWQQEIANAHGFWGPDAYANWLMSDDNTPAEEEDAKQADPMQNILGFEGDEEELERAEESQKSKVEEPQITMSDQDYKKHRDVMSELQMGGTADYDRVWG